MLPGVTDVVTARKDSSSGGSQGAGYQVTGCTLQVGDRVVLTGEGNSRPSNELKAIWTVETIYQQQAVATCETLGRRAFPLAWLVHYE